MVLKIIYVAAVIITLVCTPFFLRAQRPGKSPKSLTLKMICATGYLTVGITSVFIADNHSRFAYLMLIGFVLAWLGDLFLHLWGNRVLPCIGFVGFLAAHFLYVSAYTSYIEHWMPDSKFLNTYEIIIIAVVFASFVIYTIVSKMQLGVLLRIPVYIYGLVISTMLAKACSLGLCAIRCELPGAFLTAVLSMGGAALFIASDFTISILMFDKKQKTNYPLKVFNIVTYFVGQLMLASLLLLAKY